MRLHWAYEIEKKSRHKSRPIKMKTIDDKIALHSTNKQTKKKCDEKDAVYGIECRSSRQ